MSIVLQVDLTDTLMRLDYNLGIHVQSGERQSRWYFRVPDAWAELPVGALNSQVHETMHAIYHATNRRLRAAEPSDPNYLSPQSVTCRVLTPEEEAAKPWLGAGSPAIWEWTPCVLVQENGAYEKVAPENF